MRSGSQGSLPEGHPPIDGATPGSAASVDPNTLPLKEKGSGSEAELERGRKATSNAEAADAYARGFRLTVTPVDGTAEGKIVRPQEYYEGKEIQNLTLTFAGGKLTSMTGSGPGSSGIRSGASSRATMLSTS